MASYKKSVENYCRECIFDPIEPGSWRKQVADCTSIECPLHGVRPLPVGADRNKIDVKIIHDVKNKRLQAK